MSLMIYYIEIRTRCKQGLLGMWPNCEYKTRLLLCLVSMAYNSSVLPVRWTANTPVKGVRVIIAFNTMRDARKHWYVKAALIP
jgi:hypothetical protein